MLRYESGDNMYVLLFPADQNIAYVYDDNYFNASTFFVLEYAGDSFTLLYPDILEQCLTEEA